jgi:hypothetical protein
MNDSMTVTVLWDGREPRPVTIEPQRVLGHGRAAEATLVRLIGPDGTTLQCVEKRFAPGFLTRLLYSLCFQSPFAYQASEEAILAALFRRQVARDLMRYLHAGAHLVADAFYVRWDEASRSYVLGTEFIPGRGLIPQEVDPLFVRRFLFNSVVRPIARLFGKRLEPCLPPAEEVRELLALMGQMEGEFIRAGMVGTGWQVAKAALVSTANLLRTEEGYVVVDLESGIAALLVPYYFFAGLFKYGFPLFDDLDPDRLGAYLQEHQEGLRKALGDEGFTVFQENIHRLQEHTRRWKAGEIALGRHHFRLLFNRSLRESIKAARIDWWEKSGLIDPEQAAELRSSPRFFSRAVFLVGLLPGRMGSFLRKLLGNREFRAQVQRFRQDPQYRQEVLADYVARHVAQWRASGRLPAERDFPGFTARFAAHLLGSKFLPSSVHRFLADPAVRREVWIKVGLFLTSERFQTEFARFLIVNQFDEWTRARRLKSEERQVLQRQLDLSSMQEYVRCFGFHAAMKFFEPLTASIKLIGIGWFTATLVHHFPTIDLQAIRWTHLSGEMIAALLATCARNPLSLVLMVNTSVWRTLITLWRMLSWKRRHISYRTALMVGLIPAFGTLAYPLQMYAGCRELSIFLMRHLMAKIGQNLPIYGGKDSRTELACIKLVNLIVEPLEIGRWILDRLLFWRKPAPIGTEGPPLVPVEDPVAGSRRAALIEEKIRELWRDYRPPEE